MGIFLLQALRQKPSSRHRHAINAYALVFC